MPQFTILEYGLILSKFQFVEQTKGALLYGTSPVYVRCETERPGYLNVRGVLCRCSANKGLHPLRRYAAILV